MINWAKKEEKASRIKEAGSTTTRQGDVGRKKRDTSSYNSDYQIVGNDGKVLGQVANNSFTSMNSSVYSIRQVDPGKGANPIIYSNNGDFKAVNNGTGKFAIDAAGDSQGVSVKTDGQAVKFAINDAEKQNEVTVEGKPDDTFQITFYNGQIAGPEKQKVDISGSVQDEPVQVGVNNQQVVLNNCTDVQVSINNSPVANLEDLGKNINFYDISLEYTEAAYTGKEIKPGIKVEGRALTEGTDYTISYVDNIGSPDAETVAKAIIKGMGEYTGTKTLKFTISAGKDLKNAKVGKIKDQAYTGKAIKPAVKVTYDGQELVKDQDYTVSWKNNKKIGTATLTVSGKGSYTGTATVKFKIVPAAVKGLSLKAGKKLLTVAWKKGSGIDGYEIQYSLKKNFKGKDSKTVTINKAKTVKTTIRKLKAKKSYYVRIRAYETVKGKKFYSAWSKALKVKIK